MNLPEIKQLVGPSITVRFKEYKNGELWYSTCTGFDFPVPISDTGDATFLAEDKSIFFMRWIRKRLEFLREAMK